MSIVTKKGDLGHTSLCGGVTVMKDHAKIEANGAIDELCAHLGTAKSLVKKKVTKQMLETIQRDLFLICSEIAADPRAVGKLKERMGLERIHSLDAFIKDIETKHFIKGGHGFYLPGQDFVSSVLDIARAVARRAERRVVTLKKRRMMKNVHITAYLNRLSDFLYLLVRCHEKGHCKL